MQVPALLRASCTHFVQGCCHNSDAYVADMVYSTGAARGSSTVRGWRVPVYEEDIVVHEPLRHQHLVHSGVYSGMAEAFFAATTPIPCPLPGVEVSYASSLDAHGRAHRVRHIPCLSTSLSFRSENFLSSSFRWQHLDVQAPSATKRGSQAHAKISLCRKQGGACQ